MANDGSDRTWLQSKFNELEQKLRAAFAAAWTRLVTMVQALEAKVGHLQERMQSFEARLHDLERKTSWLPLPSDTGRLRNLAQQRARRTARLIDAHFSEDELRELCLDFHLDYANVEGDTKREKALELALWFNRRNTLDVFIGWLAGQRPRVEWPELDSLLGDEGDVL